MQNWTERQFILSFSYGAQRIFSKVHSWMQGFLTTVYVYRNKMSGNARVPTWNTS